VYSFVRRPNEQQREMASGYWCTPYSCGRRAACSELAVKPKNVYNLKQRLKFTGRHS